MKNTQLVKYARKMSKNIGINGSCENYHSSEIVMVIDELVKQLEFQQKEYQSMLRAYIND